MVVVVGEAGEARHAAGVVVLEPLEELAEFLPAFLLLLQPLALLLRWDSGGKKKDIESGTRKWDNNTNRRGFYPAYLSACMRAAVSRRASWFFMK